MPYYPRSAVDTCQAQEKAEKRRLLFLPPNDKANPHGQGGDERQTVIRRWTSSGQKPRLVRVSLTALLGVLLGCCSLRFVTFRTPNRIQFAERPSDACCLFCPHGERRTALDALTDTQFDFVIFYSEFEPVAGGR